MADDRKLHPVVGELRAVRKARGLTQSEIDGLTRSFISMAENGSRSPAFGSVVHWADELGYEIILKPKF